MKSRKKVEKIVFGDIEQYRSGSRFDYRYSFPFEIRDRSSGPDLGRIEWHVEIYPAPKHKNRKRLQEVWVWASQTRDPRYAGKVFRFNTNAEALSFDSLDGRGFRIWRFDSLDGRGFRIWRMLFCEQHYGAVVMSAYPENHHTKLVIAPASSINFEVCFE